MCIQTRMPLPAVRDDDKHTSKDVAEFFMYSFKTRACTMRRAHEWKTCCFVHKDEKVRRRDPRIHTYVADPCPGFMKTGSCHKGDACPLAHGVFETWLHPSKFRTVMCNQPDCKRKVCWFAHSFSELRSPTGGTDATPRWPAPGGAADTACSLPCSTTLPAASRAQPRVSTGSTSSNISHSGGAGLHGGVSLDDCYKLAMAHDASSPGLEPHGLSSPASSMVSDVLSHSSSSSSTSTSTLMGTNSSSTLMGTNSSSMCGVAPRVRRPVVDLSGLPASTPLHGAPMHSSPYLAPPLIASSSAQLSPQLINTGHLPLELGASITSSQPLLEFAAPSQQLLHTLSPGPQQHQQLGQLSGTLLPALTVAELCAAASAPSSPATINPMLLSTCSAPAQALQTPGDVGSQSMAGLLASLQEQAMQAQIQAARAEAAASAASSTFQAALSALEGLAFARPGNVPRTSPAAAAAVVLPSSAAIPSGNPTGFQYWL